jgi:NitT/TauT family transport system substrate-binding protein
VHAWYYWAQDKGYFKTEKLDVTIDQGEGSAATVTRIMSGAYQAGFGDVNAIVQTAAVKPGEAPVMVYMLYSRAPFAIITKTGSAIKSIKDVEGKTLGSPAGAAAYKIFSVVAKKNGIDANKVNWINMAPNLQEQMLLQGQVEGSVVFSATSYMNLVAQKVDPDKDIRWLYYSELGVDLYSNGVMVSAQLARDKPQAVAGMVRAIHHAFKDCVLQPDACIENLAQHEPLINKDIEKRRLMYTLKNLGRASLLHPDSSKRYHLRTIFGIGIAYDQSPFRRFNSMYCWFRTGRNGAIDGYGPRDECMKNARWSYHPGAYRTQTASELPANIYSYWANA